MNYKTFCSYVRGYSHIKNDLPCEDYAVSYSQSGSAIAVISDGHGDELAFRSKDGARIACESALDILKKYINNDDAVMKTLDVSKDRFFLNLKGLLLQTWLRRVNDDYTARPFSGDEIKRLSEKNRNYLFKDETNKDVHTKVYGCTLIAAYAAPQFWFCLQIGDGTCTVFYADGTVKQPMPEGKGQIANFTNSLCQTDVMQRFVHYYEKKTPLGIFVASDGLDESCMPFATSGQLPEFFRTVSEPYYYNNESADSILKAKLELMTKDGSGDDISLAAIISSDTILKPVKISKSQLQNSLNVVTKQIESKRALIKNNQHAIKQAKKEHNVNSADIERAKHIIFENEKELDKLIITKKTLETQLYKLRL